ncbi:hypothetical protein FGU65_07055 [Methanoculleus sp. FWC-SCC1]|uniref:Uncharacterized protein n=1 Tax=Methanoculleus frigidifontis TaxID=2584085 RepID=A0ABT8M9N1_9EURY|nr:hypothetical protein [Methanoculleus sp. FWC-SCC1]MDN7024648.1 hypothetical protein [Methanoculleus sp. FWC-SCC1]
MVAGRYGCDCRLAAAIVIATYLISLLTFPPVVYFVLWKGSAGMNNESPLTWMFDRIRTGHPLQ